jgi:hypothetical protein
MQILPTAAIPSQSMTAALAGQSCRINVYTKSTGLFCDLYVNDNLIVGGVICLNTVLIVRDAYFGFVGDLAFFDLQGSTDPIYSGLGTRYILGYVEASELTS